MAKRYFINEEFEGEEQGIYQRSDGYLLYVTIRDAITSLLSTPSSVDITILNPCGTVLVNAQAMSNVSTGVYSYDYAIANDAPYGRYTVDVSTTTYTMRKRYDFYVLPWDGIWNVRRISGIGQNKSISDHDLAKHVWDAYEDALNYVFSKVIDENPEHNCCQCDCEKCSTADTLEFDGTNTTFFLSHTPLADKDGDGTATGYGQQSCGTDIIGTYKDCDDICYDIWITVDDAECGKITITQSDGTAIPNNYCSVKIDYWYEDQYYDNNIFREAVEYLAAHKVLLRFGELERATSADLAAVQNIKYVDPNRMYKQYRKLIRKIASPKIGGG